ncbi:MAG: TetR/AcrR family transcriptional regulator [Kiloniellaceae bacterium]
MLDSAKTKAPRKKRMDPDAREAHIVAEAVRFFAEQGFEGKTRDLAKRIGITQPLLYRYFPSKESLIERVYQEVYVRRWNPAWEGLITDRGIPLPERLCRFYKEYSHAVYDYVWVRMFVYSGLKGVDINDRYLRSIKDKVLRPVCTELRHAHGLPTPQDVPIGAQELELAWGLHGSFFYRAIRRYIYNLTTTADSDLSIENEVTVFLAGVEAVQRKLVEAGSAEARAGKAS